MNKICLTVRAARDLTDRMGLYGFESTRDGREVTVEVDGLEALTLAENGFKPVEVEDEPVDTDQVMYGRPASFMDECDALRVHVRRKAVRL